MLTPESRTTRNISVVALKPIYLFLAFIQLTKMSLIVNAALSLESNQQQLKGKVLRVAVFQLMQNRLLQNLNCYNKGYNYFDPSVPSIDDNNEAIGWYIRI